MSIPSWRHNLERRGGFWRDGRWYDLHIERHMPLFTPMLEEMMMALPPVNPEISVCDLACGTGNASMMLVSSYLDLQLTLIDVDPKLLALAQEKLYGFASMSPRPAQQFNFVEASVEADGTPLPGGPYHLVIASLALHAIVGHDATGAEAESRYELLFQSIRDALAPGGHLIVGDHVGVMSLYKQMKAMERAGFTDVDCAWRQDDFFVCGGRLAS